jgi:hypothetical protein
MKLGSKPDAFQADGGSDSRLVTPAPAPSPFAISAPLRFFSTPTRAVIEHFLFHFLHLLFFWNNAIPVASSEVFEPVLVFFEP